MHKIHSLSPISDLFQKQSQCWKKHGIIQPKICYKQTWGQYRQCSLTHETFIDKQFELHKLQCLINEWVWKNILNVNLEDCWLQMTVSRTLVHSAGVHCLQKSSVAPLTAAEILLSLPVTLRPTDPLQLHLCLVCNIKCPIYNWI